MRSVEIIATLRQNEKDLRARSVRHAALFGSVARGDQTPESDILIDIEPETIRDVYTYVGLKTFIAELFTGRADVVDRGALRPHLRSTAENTRCMPSESPEDRLLHIRDSICKARRFTSGMAYAKAIGDHEHLDFT